MAEEVAQAAVLFADVSGSTKLYETAGDQVAKAAIDECVRIMREKTEGAKGRVIKTIGDEVMSSFPTADAAADAAIQMQEAINELKPVGNTKIGIRIGFNWGPIVTQEDGDIFGDAVNVASRLSHVAVKGQIITARDTVLQLPPMLKAATRKITAIQIKGKDITARLKRDNVPLLLAAHMQAQVKPLPDTVKQALVKALVAKALHADVRSMTVLLNLMLKLLPPPEELRPATFDWTGPYLGIYGAAIAAGQHIARTLGAMPGNLCTPDHIARTARDVGKRHKLKVTVLGRREMKRLKMGSFLAVAQGTPQDPKLVAIEYKGGRRGDAPIALVGKGLCFDSGGVSIKPADRMEWMKFDMCGAAGVIGAMEAIARMKLKVNVVGLIGSTTNMPSGTAMNPGDVVRASNGKTIEIINTDAEGRLVLADVLTYAERYKPQAVVDRKSTRLNSSHT